MGQHRDDRAGEMIVHTIAGDGQPLKVPGIVPKLSATLGWMVHHAPALVLWAHHADLSWRGWPEHTA